MLVFDVASDRIALTWFRSSFESWTVRTVRLSDEIIWLLRVTDGAPLGPLRRVKAVDRAENTLIISSNVITKRPESRSKLKRSTIGPVISPPSTLTLIPGRPTASFPFPARSRTEFAIIVKNVSFLSVARFLSNLMLFKSLWLKSMMMEDALTVEFTDDVVSCTLEPRDPYNVIPCTSIESTDTGSEN